jgi:hypothetical protein
MHFYVVWPQTGFALMTGFTGLFDTVRDYTLQFTNRHTLVSTVTSSLPLLGSDFNGGRFLFLWVPELSTASATTV